MKTHAVRIYQTGGPEVMKWEEVELPPLGPREVRLSQKAVGLNYIDTYHRSGLYPVALPAILGLEAAGVIEEAGSEVTEFRPGDRVAYGTGSVGGYTETRVMPAHIVIPLPDAISFEQAASMMLQGMTAEYLLRRTYPVKAGDWVLIHAAAGGVGQILTQWARHLGAQIIGTAGSEEKAALAREQGCHHVILYRQEDFAKRCRDLTEGRGVDVVYDGVGKSTFEGSLNSLRPRGMMVSFGNASGPVGAVDIAILAQKGSLFLTRPTLSHYTATRVELLGSAEALFSVVGPGIVKIRIGQRYPLKDAAAAHRDLEARATSGAAILIP